MSRKEREILQKIIARLIASGIIRESISDYASAAFLVYKKDKDRRLVVDYRDLNRITKRIRFPLPLIEDLIDKLGGKIYFISLDLKSGFYQIRMHPESIRKTAFVTPDGQYEFLRMAMGLANSPAVFQKVMREVLKDTNALVYIDDVLLAVESIEEGFQELEKFFEIFKRHNLTLNLKKCHFFKTKIEYLGREISAKGVQPGASKIAALVKTTDPKNIKQLRQFLGLAGYFRKFIANFAKRVAPLTRLLQKNVAWEWGISESTIVKEIKEILATRPILSIFDPSLETELYTDACAFGVGAILMQFQGKNKKVVAYYSRKTTPEEQRYHSYDLETWRYLQP